MRYKQPGSKNKIIPDEEEFDTIVMGLEELPFSHSKYTEFCTEAYTEAYTELFILAGTGKVFI